MGVLLFLHLQSSDQVLHINGCKGQSHLAVKPQTEISSCRSGGPFVSTMIVAPSTCVVLSPPLRLSPPSFGLSGHFPCLDFHTL